MSICPLVSVVLKKWGGPLGKKVISTSSNVVAVRSVLKLQKVVHMDRVTIVIEKVSRLDDKNQRISVFVGAKRMFWCQQLSREHRNVC